MAWLLTDEEFAAAREGARRGEVTEDLYAFLWRLTAATSRRNSFAPALSPTGQWDDDAVAETVQGWFEKLLGGSLQRAFDRCQGPAAFSRYMETALGNWLRDRSRGEQRPRLLVRAREQLQEGPYEAHIGSASWLDEWWGPAGWEDHEPFTGNPMELLTAAHFIGEVTLLHWSGDRADPVISTEDLRRLLGAVFALGSLLNLRLIDEVLRARFPHAFIREVDPDQMPETVAEEPSALDEMLASQGAQRALARLTERQTMILRGRLMDRKTLDDLAEEQDCSRGTIDNEVKRAITVVAEEASSSEEAELVLEKLLAMTSISTDD